MGTWLYNSFTMDSKSLFYPANTGLKSNYGHSLKVKLYDLVTKKTLLLIFWNKNLFLPL